VVANSAVRQLLGLDSELLNNALSGLDFLSVQSAAVATVDNFCFPLRKSALTFLLELPVKLEDQLTRSRIRELLLEVLVPAQILFGSSVTLKAPLHLEGVALPSDVHIIHCAVTSVTVDTSVHVDGVVEEDKIWNLVDLVPLDWRSRLIALSHRIEEWRVRPDLRVATHARLGRWNASIA
jgi:hypothetical protein